MRHHRAGLVLPAAFVVAGLAAAPASAEIFATFDGPGFGTTTGISSINVTTGAGQGLPSGVNTTVAHELHPTLSPDRRYLAFLRMNFPQTTRSVLMVDRTTGQIAEVLTSDASDRQNSPTFSADGTAILTGRRLEHRDAGTPPEALQASFTRTDVTGFPNGPFPQQIVAAGGLDSTSPGRTVQQTPFIPGSFAFGTEFDDTTRGRVTVQQASGTTTLVDAAARLAHPTISLPAGVVVYDMSGRLVSRPLNGIATAPVTALPPLVNKPGGTLSHPTFSRDGRYLAFKRFDPSGPGAGRSALYVWDRLTQLLLNPAGVVVRGPNSREGGIALEVTNVILTAGLAVPGAVNFTLAQPSRVGIIVQRIVGRTRVLGRRAPKLRLVGRVPLGTFKKGRRHRVRWDQTIDGRPLRPGRYLVTVRSVTRKTEVRDLARPVRVRIR
jgi:WD40-like Beta Propeller Repeat